MDVLLGERSVEVVSQGGEADESVNRTILERKLAGSSEVDLVRKRATRVKSGRWSAVRVLTGPGPAPRHSEFCQKRTLVNLVNESLFLVVLQAKSWFMEKVACSLIRENLILLSPLFGGDVFLAFPFRHRCTFQDEGDLIQHS